MHFIILFFRKHVLCVCVRSSFAGAPPSHPMDIVMVVRQRMGSKRYHQIALCIPGRSIPALRARISTQPSGIFPRKVLSKTNQLQIIRRTDEVFQKGHISEPCLTSYMLFVFSSHHVVCFLFIVMFLIKQYFCKHLRKRHMNSWLAGQRVPEEGMHGLPDMNSWSIGSFAKTIN